MALLVFLVLLGQGVGPDRQSSRASWSWRAAAARKELQNLDARLARLRTRLVGDDPDLTADELQAGIARVEAKRAELMTTQALPKASAQVLSLLPKAAAWRISTVRTSPASRPSPPARPQGE